MSMQQELNTWEICHLCKGSGISCILEYSVMTLTKVTGLIERETRQQGFQSVTPAIRWIKASLALVHVQSADTHNWPPIADCEVSPYLNTRTFFFQPKDESWFLRMCPYIVLGVLICARCSVAFRPTQIRNVSRTVPRVYFYFM